MRRLLITIVSLCIFSSHSFALSVGDSGGATPLKKHSPTRSARTADVKKRPATRETYTRAKREYAQPQLNAQLRLRSGSALVIDQTNGTVLFGKNAGARQPIASITKLMTAMVMLDAQQPLDEKITITDEDVDRVKHSTSRLSVKTVLSRLELLQLALMASENRAASSLARSYPGGTSAFVDAMNNKAVQLGMANSTFADATGLDERNVSTASDLVKMVDAAYAYDLIRQVSTSQSSIVEVNNFRATQFRNTNALVRTKDWEIGLSKTGFIREAGHCLVMQVQISARNLIIILLDAQGKMTRVGDANRIKKWLERTQLKQVSQSPETVPSAS